MKTILGLFHFLYFVMFLTSILALLDFCSSPVLGNSCRAPRQYLSVFAVEGKKCLQVNWFHLSTYGEEGARVIWPSSLSSVLSSLLFLNQEIDCDQCDEGEEPFLSMERVTVWVYTAVCKSRITVLKSVTWDQEPQGLYSMLQPTTVGFSMVVYHKTSGLKFLICRDNSLKEHSSES